MAGPKVGSHIQGLAWCQDPESQTGFLASLSGHMGCQSHPETYRMLYNQILVADSYLFFFFFF